MPLKDAGEVVSESAERGDEGLDGRVGVLLLGLEVLEQG